MKQLFFCCILSILYCVQARATSIDMDVPITTVKHLYCNKEHSVVVCTTRTFEPYTGIIKEEYSNGHLKVMAYFKNGKANGLRKEYYENGQLKEESYYKNGKLDGLVVSYYKNGLLEQEAYYKDGRIDGRWKLYDKDGSIQDGDSYYNKSNAAASYSYQHQ